MCEQLFGAFVIVGGILVIFVIAYFVGVIAEKFGIGK